MSWFSARLMVTLEQKDAEITRLQAENASLRERIRYLEAESINDRDPSLWRFWNEKARSLAEDNGRLREQVEKAREAALEEAAKVAASMPVLRPISTSHVKSTTPGDVALAIRALKDREERG